MVHYDPDVIYKFAQKLYDRADAILLTYSVGCGFLTLFVGGVAVSTLDLGDRDLTFLIPIFIAMFGTAVGAIIGRARGFELRLEAQAALCQVQIEINGRPPQVQVHAAQARA